MNNLIYVNLVLLAFASPILAAQNESTQDVAAEIRGYQQIVKRTGTFEDFLIEAATKAEQLRQSCLKPGPRGSQAQALAKLMNQFSRQKFTATQAATLLDTNLFLKKIHGEKTTREFGIQKARDIFGAFQGKWFGRWQDFDVDHHWSEVVTCEPPIPFDGGPGNDSDFFIDAYQYAWIGDGYGVNLMTREIRNPSNPEPRIHFTGYVEHLRNGDFKKIVARRPHIAVVGRDPGTICWITAAEVFFERASIEPNDKTNEYSILGFHYSIERGIASIDKAFFTRYGRNPAKRTPFAELKINFQLAD